MSLPTRKVTCVLRDQFGNPVAGARIQFRMTAPDIYPGEGVVAPETIEARAAEDGTYEVDLFPNALGLNGTQYRVRAWNPDDGRKFVDGMVTVPDEDCLLHDILGTTAPEEVGPAQAAAIAAQASAVLARSWAIKTDGPVADGEFSAKHHAQAAATSASGIGTAVEDAQTASLEAQQARDDAQAAVTAAQAAETAAEAAQTAAAGSASTALTAAGQAQGHASDAQAAESAAESARDAAAASQSAAAGSASSASGSASAAAGSASAASGSAVAAAQSVTDAAAQVTLAQAQVTLAQGHATAAQGSATTAAGHASAAGTSASNASASAGVALGAAADAETALSDFSRLYLGPKAADPTVDNEGNPLLVGAFYFRTVSPTIRVWNGSTWLNAPQGPPGDVEDLGGVAMLADPNTFAGTNQFNAITSLFGGLRMAANAREFATTTTGAAAASTLVRLGEFTFPGNDQELVVTGLVGMHTADSYALNSFVLIAKSGTLPTKTLKFYKDGDGASLAIDIKVYENPGTGRVVIAADTMDGGNGLHWAMSVTEAGAYDAFTIATSAAALNTSGLNEVAAATDLIADISTGMRFHELVEFLGGVSGLTKADVGLGAVDNTADADKPVSDAAAAALALKANLASPALTGAPTAPSPLVSDDSTRLATTEWVKDQGYITSAPAAPVTSVAGKTGVVTLVKADVGLGSVDNTADSAKPVSTAQQTALNLKANLASPTFTGTVSGITKAMVGLGNVDNTADSAKPVSTAQQTALNLKANLASPSFTGTVTAPTLSVSGSARGSVQAVAASAIDAATGNYFTKTAAGNLTWTVANVPASSSWFFLLRLTNGGAYTMTWPASFKWPGGVAPILTAAGVDLIIGVTDDGGTTFRCAAILDVK